MSENVMDRLFYKIKATAGLCTPTVEHLKDYLEKAKQYTEKAQQTSKFVAISPGIAERLSKANESIGGILETLESAENHAGDIGAACQISEALAVLNDWASNPHGDNAKAAAAFDNLFGGLSVYAEKLPVPANAYARILKQISVARFFTNMQRLGESRVGGNTSTPTGQAMKQVLDELDSQGRGGH